MGLRSVPSVGNIAQPIAAWHTGASACVDKTFASSCLACSAHAPLSVCKSVCMDWLLGVFMSALPELFDGSLSLQLLICVINHVLVVVGRCKGRPTASAQLQPQPDAETGQVTVQFSPSTSKQFLVHGVNACVSVQTRSAASLRTQAAVLNAVTAKLAHGAANTSPPSLDLAQQLDPRTCSPLAHSCPCHTHPHGFHCLSSPVCQLKLPR